MVSEKQKAESQTEEFASLLGETDSKNQPLTNSFEKMTLQYNEYKNLLKIYNEKVSMYSTVNLTMKDLKIIDPYSIYKLKVDELEHIFSSHDMRRVEDVDIIKLDEERFQNCAFVKVSNQRNHREYDESYHIAFYIRINDGTKWVINIHLQDERREIYDLLISQPTEDEILLSQRKDFTIIYLEGLYDVLSLMCALVRKEDNVNAGS
ncbi:hypothetical protein ACOI1C_06315 [Bacillus sp. DJP31]|uniref:hypothetical protein n=1 Tax=Bacillus sp. DJP31 TaxID=3409789 RepID=UPI003BB64291